MHLQISNQHSVSSCTEMLIVPRTLTCVAAEIMSAYEDGPGEQTGDFMTLLDC